MNMSITRHMSEMTENPLGILPLDIGAFIAVNFYKILL